MKVQWNGSKGQYLKTSVNERMKKKIKKVCYDKDGKGTMMTRKVVNISFLKSEN